MTTWVTPSGATASTPATAADFETHMTDLLHLRERTTQKPKVRARRTGTAITLATGTNTAVEFDAELLDSHAMHDTSTNPSRFYAPTGYSGWYHILGGVEFNANATGVRELAIRANGSDILGRVRSVPASGQNWMVQVSAYVYLAAGEYVELIATQTSGGNLDINNQNYWTPMFAMSYDGEDD